MDDHSPQWTRCTPPFFTHQQSYFEWQIHEMSPVQIAPWHGWYSPMGLFISPSGLLRSLKLLGLLLGFLQLISLRLPSGNQFHGWENNYFNGFRSHRPFISMMFDNFFQWPLIWMLSQLVMFDRGRWLDEFRCEPIDPFQARYLGNHTQKMVRIC